MKFLEDDKIGSPRRAGKSQVIPAIRLVSLSMVALTIATAAVMVAAGCGSGQKHDCVPPVADPAPAVEGGIECSPRTFIAVSAGASMTYPSGWEPQPTDSFVLMLVPASSPSRSAGDAPTLLWGEHFISLDIPELPAFRIPGFLPMGRICSGYVDHLRKQMPHATTVFLQPPSIPDAEASLVRTTWPGDHPTHVETALILTHADRVYILRARSPVEDALSTRAAFEQVVGSLRWSGDGSDRGRSALAAAGQVNR